MGGYQFSRQPRKVPTLETRFRTIKTEIPCPGTEKILAQLDEVESRSMHGQLPLVWDKAIDFNIWDKAGNRWIDFTSTIFVTNIGHSNPHLIKRIRDDLDKGLLHTYAYANEIRALYLNKLVQFAGKNFQKAFLLSAGTEATEAALKLMRMNGQKIGKKRSGIVCIEGNWHGRTMGAQMMSSNAAQKAWIGYEDPNIHHLPFPYPWKLNGQSGKDFFQTSIQALEQKGVNLREDLAGFMLETFQGWGAVFYPQDYVSAIREFADQNQILVAFDEMQAGFARTGKRFGYEHYNVKADLLCCGKGMSSGLPLSGVIGSKEVMDLPEVGNMSSTHSANPLVCAAGLATLEEIENKNLVEETARKGAILHQALEKLKNEFPQHITRSLGHGLLAALHFSSSEFPSLVSERAMQKGLLVVHTGRESIKLAPPLTIPDEALVEAIQTLRESIAEIAAQ